MQISWLCAKVSKTEWSGYCFYTMEGDVVNDPDNFVITVHYAALMSVDSPGRTSFRASSSVLKVYDFREDLETCRRGFLHSHHSMNAYFSAEDDDELKKSTADTSFYVSLIVNNAHNFVARICQEAKCNVTIDNLSYRNTENKWITISDNKTVEKTIVRYWDLFIKYPEAAEQANYFIELDNKKRLKAAQTAKQEAGTQAELFDKAVPHVPKKTVWEGSYKNTSTPAVYRFIAELLTQDEFALEMEGFDNILSNIEEIIEEERQEKRLETVEDIKGQAEDIVALYLPEFDSAGSMRNNIFSLIGTFKDKYPLVYKLIKVITNEKL